MKSILLILIITCSIYPQSYIASNFEVDDDGWAIVNNGSSTIPDYFPFGGNPGGYISDKDAVFGVWHFLAPSKFLGDVSEYYGDTLRFDLKQSLNGTVFDHDVLLDGNGITIYYDMPFYPGFDWTSYLVSVDVNGGWKNLSTGLPATQSEILSVLSSLSSLKIRGDFFVGTMGDTTAIDNVILGTDFIPVELISFTGTYNQLSSVVILSWVTATETNNFGFEIERTSALPNTEWGKIGFVKGNGTTTEIMRYVFQDDIENQGNYKYRLKQIDFDGKINYSNTIEVEVIRTTEFTLSQNYPNPFNPTTLIKYQIPVESFTTLKVYDVLGNEVVTLVKDEKTVGNYEVEFNATGFASGVYLYKLQAGEFVEVKKMIILK